MEESSRNRLQTVKTRNFKEIKSLKFNDEGKPTITSKEQVKLKVKQF